MIPTPEQLENRRKWAAINRKVNMLNPLGCMRVAEPPITHDDLGLRPIDIQEACIWYTQGNSNVRLAQRIEDKWITPYEGKL